MMTTEQLGKTLDSINEFIRLRPYDVGAYEDLLSVYKGEMDREDAEREEREKTGWTYVKAGGNNSNKSNNPNTTGDAGSAQADSSEDANDGSTVSISEQAGPGFVDWHRANRLLRDKIVAVMGELVTRERYRDVEGFNIQYRRSLLMDARVDFDAYMLYIESDRESERRFWLPRRGILLPVARDMERLINGELQLLAVSLPPGVGKTTLAIFLLTWIAGRWPDEYNVIFSHDGDILKGMYSECLRFMSKDGEYLWGDVFPEVPLVSTNAKDLRIDLGHGSRFETLQFASIGSDNAGKVRASKLLYCDDLVGGIEQAMSRERMDKLWTQYTADIQQRGTGEYRELHVATRWSVADVIGRLEQNEADNPMGKKKFIAVPALNEKDESNFDYPTIKIGSFSTERYHALRSSMNDVDWRALYMNEPIEREGQLYNEDELRRYFELPKMEPDAIIAVCDTKAKGSDYCVMPVAYQYGDDYYIDAVVCDNGDPGIVEERLAVMLVNRRVQLCQFESNSAGWKVAEDVQKRVRELGGICSISTKPTTANKETKIVSNKPFIVEHFLFKDKGQYTRREDYGQMMFMLTGYTIMGKNKHDDVPDAMAMLALYAQSFGMMQAAVMRRPF